MSKGYLAQRYRLAAVLAVGVGAFRTCPYLCGRPGTGAGAPCSAPEKFVLLHTTFLGFTDGATVSVVKENDLKVRPMGVCGILLLTPYRLPWTQVSGLKRRV